MSELKFRDKAEQEFWELSHRRWIEAGANADAAIRHADDAVVARREAAIAACKAAPKPSSIAHDARIAGMNEVLKPLAALLGSGGTFHAVKTAVERLKESAKVAAVLARDAKAPPADDESLKGLRAAREQAAQPAN